MPRLSSILLFVGLLAVVQSATVVDVIAGNKNLTTLASLVKSAGLAGALAGTGPFTVFAPTNDAFAAIPDYKVKLITAADNLDILKGVLDYHVASGNLSTSAFVANEKIPTLQGSNVFIQFIDHTTTLGMASATCEKNVRFMGKQIEASNGIVHIIDAVLMPPAVLCPDELFWVEQRGQSRVGFDGYDCRAKGQQQISTNEVKPVGIAVDSAEELVFWSNDENAKPNDSWLTKSSFTKADPSVFLPGVYDPQGMDTDTSAKKLYFTQHQGNTVNRVNYDGSDTELVWQGRTGLDFPADVAVDSEAGLVFTTVQSVPTVLNGTLRVQNLDGTGHRVLQSGLVKNYGLCLDTHARHVYYIQGGNGGSLSCMAYGKTPCNTTSGGDGIVLGGLQYPYMCVVDNLYAPYGGPTRVVFSEPNVPGSVYMVNNDGSELTLIASDLDAPMGLKLGCRRFTA